MNGFDFRNKYIDVDGDGEADTIITDEDPLDLDFDDEVIEEEDIKVQTKKEKNRHTILVVLAICIVVIISSVILGGYVVFRSAKAPKIVTVHIESDNFENPSEAKYGNMITLSFSFEEELANIPRAIINNKNVEVYGEGKDFYAKYFVQLQEQKDIDVEFSIHDYRNKYKKTGPPITETTDGSSVVIPAFK
ncbi:MAG: hypothetical protein IKF71_04585 [Bacilli bacterium]|nr:hypothetical protein [Bacilli bacterium]